MSYTINVFSVWEMNSQYIPVCYNLLVNINSVLRFLYLFIWQNYMEIVFSNPIIEFCPKKSIKYSHGLCCSWKSRKYKYSSVYIWKKIKKKKEKKERKKERKKEDVFVMFCFYLVFIVAIFVFVLRGVRWGCPLLSLLFCRSSFSVMNYL